MACSASSLEYCTDPGGGFKVLYNESGQSDIWVHAACGRPSDWVWHDWRRRCSSCRKWFSSPTESSCQDCSPNERYESWLTLLTESDTMYHPAIRPVDHDSVDGDTVQVYAGGVAEGATPRQE